MNPADGTVHDPVAELFGDRPPSRLLAAWYAASRLKRIHRRGWLARGLPAERGESVADHVFGVAVLALLLGPGRPALDPGRLLRLALVHDLGESGAGDLIPSDGVPPAEKTARERAALAALAADLTGGAELLADWEDYEAGASPEARFVRQLDRLEMALQAVAYARTEGLPPGEFLASAGRAVDDPELRGFLDELATLLPAGD